MKAVDSNLTIHRTNKEFSTSPQPFPQTVVIMVPLVPPSCNNYVRHTRTGGHYLIPAAQAFKDAVAIFARGSSIQAKFYAVTIDLYLGFNQRLDVDNSAKLTIDSLVNAHVIDSDAKVIDLHLRKHRDPKNPRTGNSCFRGSAMTIEHIGNEECRLRLNAAEIRLMSAVYGLMAAFYRAQNCDGAVKKHVLEAEKILLDEANNS